MIATTEPGVIHVRDLVVGFGKQTVLDHLSLDVHRERFSVWSAHLAGESQYSCDRSLV
jgi:ABC-type transporter Mla maintaining outer membrane lipid asymmetry ATPase subunit MlaF